MLDFEVESNTLLDILFKNMLFNTLHVLGGDIHIGMQTLIAQLFHQKMYIDRISLTALPL